MEPVFFSTFVAITIGLVEAIKRTAPSLEKFAPIYALVFGVLLSFSQGWTVESGLTGLVVGLSASGLYSGTKNLIKK